MTEQVVEQKAMPGECSYCSSQVEKKKMTQHLKYCKQRLEAIAAEKQDITNTGKARKKSKAEPVTFFHLLVEGRYNPQYWMHIEMPASDELLELDGFLRDIWVECCDHLSSFEIGGVTYSDERGDFLDFGFMSGAGNVVEEEEKEEEEEEGEISMEEVLAALPDEYGESLSPQFREEFVKFRDPYEAVKFLRAELKAAPKDYFPYSTREEREELKRNIEQYRESFLKNMFLESTLKLLITMLEDRSLYQPLERLLEVGKKFTYEYDFGSTTYLNLKMMGKRDGIIHEKEDRVKVLARNLPPGIKCIVCGNPATQVVSGYFDVEENAYCSKCAKKSEDYELMLPVVNSPRVGVCGYTG